MTLDKIRRWLRNWLCLPMQPGPMYLVQLKETKMSNVFEATVTLPPLAEGEAGEVTQRRFSYAINNSDPVVDTFPVAEVLRVFKANQNDLVHCELFNIDDAGNVSPTSSVLDFMVTDVIAPAAPGEMSVTLVELP